MHSLKDGVGAHLGIQRRCLAQREVGIPVQGYPVPDGVLAHTGNEPVASTGVDRTGWSKRSCVLRRIIPLDRRRGHHDSWASGNMLTAFDRAVDDLSAETARRTAVV